MVKFLVKSFVLPQAFVSVPRVSWVRLLLYGCYFAGLLWWSSPGVLPFLVWSD